MHCTYGKKYIHLKMLLSFFYGLILLAVALASSQSFQYGQSRVKMSRAATHQVLPRLLLDIRGGNHLEMTSTGEAETTDTLIKFYMMKGGTCPFAARTGIALVELGLPFETIEVSPMKEDW
jgi:hypothetical protein